jgi:biopolymer transport protein ExbB/TolQ
MQAEGFTMLGFIKDFMINGGVFMWVILLVWCTGIGLSFYKFVTLQAFDINSTKLFDKIKGLVLQNNVEEAIQTCSNTNAVLPKILRSGLKRANEERILIEDAISTSIMEHTPKITYKLSYISLIANISTLIGLLGTIQGLIMSFAGVAGADPGSKAKILAMGIAKAMNTTAFGLVSAITIMVLHTILTNKALQLNDRIDETAGKLIDLLSIKQKKSE